MTTYHINIGGQSWDEFEASNDDEAMGLAQAFLEAGPHGDPADGPAIITAGVFDPDDNYLGEVSVSIE